MFQLSQKAKRFCHGGDKSSFLERNSKNKQVSHGRMRDERQSTKNYRKSKWHRFYRKSIVVTREGKWADHLNLKSQWTNYEIMKQSWNYMNRNQRNLGFIFILNSSPMWFTLGKPLNLQASKDDATNVLKIKQKIPMNQHNISHLCFLPITNCVMPFFIFQVTLVLSFLSQSMSPSHSSFPHLLRFPSTLCRNVQTFNFRGWVVDFILLAPPDHSDSFLFFTKLCMSFTTSVVCCQSLLHPQFLAVEQFFLKPEGNYHLKYCSIASKFKRDAFVIVIAFIFWIIWSWQPPTLL